VLTIFLLALLAGLPTALLMLPGPRRTTPAPAQLFDAEDWRQMREHLPPDVYAWMQQHAEGGAWKS